jgi:hypothetical protein
LCQCTSGFFGLQLYLVGFEPLACGLRTVGEHKIGWEEKGNKDVKNKRGGREEEEEYVTE